MDVTLSPEDQATWRAAVQARMHVQQRAEIAVMRAKVAISDAHDAERQMLEEMAARYGFDPDQSWGLQLDGRLVAGSVT